MLRGIIERRRWSLLTLAAAVVAIAAVGGTALAGHVEGSVPSYTGCVVSSSGSIVNLKEGDAPAKPCNAEAGFKEIHVSGGDVTAIVAGPGLTGGGTTGAVTIGLSAQQSLPSCSNGQVPKWSGSAWACAGDDDTQYTAGTGLDLTGTTFSVEPDAFAKKDQSCAAGQLARGIDGGGALVCAAGSAPTAYFAEQASRVTVKDDFQPHDVVRLQLPAGKYALSASGTIGADTLSGVASGDCRLGTATKVDSQDYADGEHVGTAAATSSPVSLHIVVTLAAAGSVAVQCRAFSSDDQAHANGFEIVAIAVG